MITTIHRPACRAALAVLLILGRTIGSASGLAPALASAEEPAAGVAQALAPFLEPLVKLSGVPPVQFLVPDLEVRELPVALTNQINLVYAPDGRLFAAGYDGRLHLLTDRDGDGLEDTATALVATTSDDFAIGMAWHGDALYELRRHQLIRHEIAPGPAAADHATVVASGWDDPIADHDPLYTHRRVDDALGLAIAADGTIYLSKGAANYGNPYLVGPDKQSHLDLARLRGCVLRIVPGGKPTVFATGVRFLVSMQVDRQGDLFATDQEGATWIPNGNPLDELLRIQEGRHYGFPPRHPIYLPAVIDEPSVFDYAPQHQSTCGFRFNEPAASATAFGPPSWLGDAIVTGESRGKLFRTKLVKTPVGYVARSEVIACLDSLPIDVAFSPAGDLVLACHSGRPDWGSGPKGAGHLFKIAYADHGTPQVIAIGALSPTQTQIAFDRPVPPALWATYAQGMTLAAGRYALPGDDCEAFRPGYRAVDVQQQEPRLRVPIASLTLSADRCTATVVTAPRVDDRHFVLSTRLEARAPRAHGIASLPLCENGFDLGGVAVSWSPPSGVPAWSGWLPHPDLTVARAFTASSGAHAALWPLLATAGVLRLSGQFDLAQMLRPAVQPGSHLDYTLPSETVAITISGTGPLTLTGMDGARIERLSPRESRMVVADPQRWVPFSLTLATGGGAQEAGIAVSWTTAEDPRPRALPLRRVRMPWVVPLGVQSHERDIPEIAGGDARAGKALFFSGFPGCAHCHSIRGAGGAIAPDLSNLVQRDYASVLRDIIQPSATINPDYPQYAISCTDGRTLQGVIVDHDATGIRLGDITGAITHIDTAAISATHALPTSLMPEGLLSALSQQQVRDLMCFLLTASEP